MTKDIVQKKLILEDDILSVIGKLNPNKAHEHDQFSICMIQIFDKAKYKPLYLNFSSCVESGNFPAEWKISNNVLSQDKQNVENYELVSLLPIFGNKFERLIYNKVYPFFRENDSVSPIFSFFFYKLYYTL